MFVTRQDYRAPLNIQAISKGTIISLVLTLIFIFATAMLSFYMNIAKEWLNGINIALYLLSCFLGGVISAKIAGFKGLWHGIIAGFFIFIIAFLVSLFIVPGHLVVGYLMKKFIVSVISGAIGGVMGIAIG